MWSSSKRPAHAIRLTLQRFKDVGILRQVRDFYWLQAIPANWDLLTDGHIDGNPVKAKLGQVLALWGPMSKVAPDPPGGLAERYPAGRVVELVSAHHGQYQVVPDAGHGPGGGRRIGLGPRPVGAGDRYLRTAILHHLGAAVGGVCRGASDPESGRVPVEDDPVSGLPFTCSEKDHQHRESAISGDRFGISGDRFGISGDSFLKSHKTPI